MTHPRQRLAGASALVLLLTFGSIMVSAQDTVYPPGWGPDPQLPPPEPSTLPTMNWSVDREEDWPVGLTPKPAQGLRVMAFAKELKHPRWIHVLPNGDVLVAEAAAEPSDSWNPRALVQTAVQRRAGSITENANRISLLRDTDGDGAADEHHVFLEGLRQPFGMALVGDQLYVANTDSVVRFPYREGDTKIADKGTKIMDLKVGHHWTRALLAGPEGKTLFVTVGSGSNIAEKGIEKEEGRAAIHAIDLATGTSRLYASGLRNPNGMDFEPNTGVLWTVVNERDEIGDNLPPDYLTSVKDGGFYGWPYSYWGKNVDERVRPPRPDLVATALTPDYALGAHTSSIGLTFAKGRNFPDRFREGAFIGQHGSWNRAAYSGYEVVFVPFRDGKPNGPPVDVLTGFMKDTDSGVTYGRPVGVTFDTRGGLLVADDVGNTIWRVAGEAAATTGAAQPNAEQPKP